MASTARGETWEGESREGAAGEPFARQPERAVPQPITPAQGPTPEQDPCERVQTERVQVGIARAPGEAIVLGESMAPGEPQSGPAEDWGWATQPCAGPDPVCEVRTNVGSGERMVSMAAGSLLSLMGLERRGKFGWLVAGLGGAMLYRGLTGRCHLYQALDVSTADEQPQGLLDNYQAVAGERGSRFGKRPLPAKDGIHVTESLLINQPAEKLYDFWRRLENLPQVLSHLKSVQPLEGNRSHWIAQAPGIVGGQVQWDAEVTIDEPHSYLAWRSLPGSEVESHGSIRFTAAPGDRGTAVRVEMKYLPPGGQLGHWLSKLFGEAADQQIHEDLRNFKRLMETGEVLSVAGQARGACR